MEEMEFNFEDETKDGSEFSYEDAQIPLDAVTSKTYADIVFVIDVTGSMQPCIDKVKMMATSLYDDLVVGMKKFNKEFAQVRVRVIAFRDYYCDGKYAMQESDFFYLPDEANAFKNYVEGLQAKGGGDAPENSLEALALAMKTDWVQEGTSRRHIIMLFTDATAHPFEKNADNKPELYPKDMLKSYQELVDAWNVGQGVCEGAGYEMDNRAKRLVLFAPDDEVWNDVEEKFENTQRSEINPDEGGRELQKELIMNLLCKSCV